MLLAYITAMILMETLSYTSKRLMMYRVDLKALMSKNTKGLRPNVGELYFLMALDIIAAVSLVSIIVLLLILI
jgi:hypothetical protein